MHKYSIPVEFGPNQVKELSAPYSFGQVEHQEAFSWMPTTTHTNGEDSFFAVPAQQPALGKSVKVG